MKESSNYAVEIYYDNTLVYDTKLDEDINQK